MPRQAAETGSTGDYLVISVVIRWFPPTRHTPSNPARHWRSSAGDIPNAPLPLSRMAAALRFLNDRQGFKNPLKPPEYARKDLNPAPEHPLHLLTAAF
jgi:hypothetical protein